MPLSKEALVFLSDEELLDLIIEECAELIYVASKAKRFGLEDINPTKPDAGSNVYEIALEHAQLSNLVTCLAARFGLAMTTCWTKCSAARERKKRAASVTPPLRQLLPTRSVGAMRARTTPIVGQA